MAASEFDRRRERDLIETWLRANEGLATVEELKDLSDWLENEADARQLILAVSNHQGWLAWQGGPTPAMEPSRCVEVRDGESNSQRSARSIWRSRVAELPTKLLGIPLLSARGIAAVACFVVAIVWLQQWIGVDSRLLAPDSHLLDARFIGGTRCVWDSAGVQHLGENERLREGDSLQLLEGIAELSLEHNSTVAELVMEGPAAVVLARKAVPSLRYGKITVATDAPAIDRFPVETSFGRVMLEAGSEVGISAFGDSAEVHVFAGVATIESPWLVSREQGIVTKVVSAGNALFFDGVGDVALQVTEGRASREGFTPQVSMQSDFLAVDSEYVNEIRSAKPLAYWRFEQEDRLIDDQGEIVLNEMGDRFHGRLKGKVRWAGPQGNQAIEFGVTPEPGSMVVEDSWDEVLDGDFTVEAWIKASHYHLGSILGFIGEFDWQDRRNEHGVLLEVGGTSQPSTIHQPERIRWLHRPKLGVHGGVACFSDRSYQPRRWQHIVAVRHGDSLRLYLDGEQVASATDPERMALGLQLVLGQLYTETVERFFIGHVDEVVIYDRALEDSQIMRHYMLLRAGANPPVDKSKEQPIPANLSVVGKELSVTHALLNPFLEMSL
jgi:hypothetical protein